MTDYQFRMARRVLTEEHLGVAAREAQEREQAQADKTLAYLRRRGDR